MDIIKNNIYVFSPIQFIEEYLSALNILKNRLSIYFPFLKFSEFIQNYFSTIKFYTHKFISFLFTINLQKEYSFFTNIKKGEV